MIIEYWLIFLLGIMILGSIIALEVKDTLSCWIGSIYGLFIYAGA